MLIYSDERQSTWDIGDLLTNSFLFKIKKNNGCSNCNEQRETIKHLFLNCIKVKDFWNSLQDWLSNNCNIILHLDERSLIFSSQKPKIIERARFTKG